MSAWLSPLALRRARRFRGMRRAWWSLLVLSGAFALSLGSELIANDKPIVMRYEGRLYFPIVFFHPETEFGGELHTEPSYRELRRGPAFKREGNWMLMPPIPYGPNESLLYEVEAPPSPPTLRNLLGTDDRGRDVMARLIYGFRVSMGFSLLLALSGVALGCLIGGVQGFFGGLVDLGLQRLVEILGMLPFLYVVILAGSILGQGFWVLLLVYSVFDWIGLSYYVRAEFYRLREFPFVEAARAMGIGRMRIILRHILPNAMTPVITFLPFMLISAIFSLSALDYLGFGLPPPTPSWGELMRQGLENLDAYWLSVFPFAALFATLLLTAFVGEGLRDAFDPKEFSRLE